MSFPFYFILESNRVSSETTGTATNQVLPEQADVSLKGYIPIATKRKASEDVKFNKSSEWETLPEHEGARTGN